MHDIAFLGVFAKFEKATISFFMCVCVCVCVCVCLSVHMELLGSYWMISRNADIRNF